MFTQALALFAAAAQSFVTVQPPQHPAQQKSEPQVHGFDFVPSAPEQAYVERQGGWVGVSLIDNPGVGPSIGQVIGGSPAEHAGLHPGDRIVSLDGKPVASTDAVIKYVAQKHPGTEVEVQVRRDIAVVLDGEHKSAQGALVFGVELGAAQRVDADEGVGVRNLLDGWPAHEAGVQPGDVLLSVEGKRVASSAHVTNVLKSIEEPREVHVVIARKIQVTLGTPRVDLGLELVQPRQVRPWTQPPPVVVPQPPSGAKPRVVPPSGAQRSRTPQSANTDALLDEVRALSQQLRELREQIAGLRNELDQMQRRR